MIGESVVRLATLNDAADIAEMSRHYVEQGLHWRRRFNRVARAIKDPEINAAVVGSPGALLAFGIMSYREEDAHLLLFAVRTAHRRIGVGSAVLQWLEAVARTAGTQRIVVEARLENAAARSFYSEHGYHERAIEKAMYGRVVDGVRLEKWLLTDA